MGLMICLTVRFKQEEMKLIHLIKHQSFVAIQPYDVFIEEVAAL
ncbi:hypothetical protein ACMGE9_04470 [Macrococcus sp. EM39E]